MSGQTILLIEDENMLSRLYGDMMTAKGYIVSAASGVEEALGVLEENLPDIILTDIMMPEIDGIKGCGMIRERFGEDIPILFVSALDDRETINQAFAAGGADYLTKQASLEDILNRIELWLETPPAERASQTERFRADMA